MATASSENPCAAARSDARIAAPEEPGEPLRVSGVVYGPDGVTPAAGLILFVYHTDAKGLYAPEPNADPRLHAWLRTDAQGRYAFTTIRPAPYPNARGPAHVHTELWGEGVPPQYGPELLFADDPRVPQAERTKSDALGRFAFVKTPEKREGVWVVVGFDIRSKRTGDARLMGLAACRSGRSP